MIDKTILTLTLTFIAVFLQTTSAQRKQKLFGNKWCEDLLCPKDCNLTFFDGCPHNCNCGTKQPCEPLICPWSFPRCLTLTNNDGCQVCVCQDPKTDDVGGAPPPAVTFGLDAAKKRECIPDYHFKLNVYMEWLNNQLQWRVQYYASSTLPMIYNLRDNDVLGLCQQFNEAVKFIDPAVISACLYENERLTTVYSNLYYPCNNQTAAQFQKYYSCLSKDGGRRNVIKSCGAVLQQGNPGKDTCKTFDVLNGCIYDRITRICGYDGWEFYYKYLAQLAMATDRNCRLKRSYRLVR